MAIALALHVLTVLIWVGGMFFAYVCLRPVAATVLEPPLRLSLWAGVFRRFFPLVWLAVAVILATGYWMVFKFGGFKAVPLYIHLMNGLGLVMMAIFFYVFFGPWKTLAAAVAAQNWPEGGAALARIRVAVGINTTLGLIVVALATGGRYLLR